MIAQESSTGLLAQLAPVSMNLMRIKEDFFSQLQFLGTSLLSGAVSCKEDFRGWIQADPASSQHLCEWFPMVNVSEIGVSIPQGLSTNRRRTPLTSLKAGS